MNSIAQGKQSGTLGLPRVRAVAPLQVVCSKSTSKMRPVLLQKTLPLMGATRLEAAEKCPDAGQGKLL